MAYKICFNFTSQRYVDFNIFYVRHKSHEVYLQVVAVEQVFDRSDEVSDEEFQKLEDKLKNDRE